MRTAHSSGPHSSPPLLRLCPHPQHPSPTQAPPPEPLPHAGSAPSSRLRPPLRTDLCCGPGPRPGPERVTAGAAILRQAASQRGAPTRLGRGRGKLTREPVCSPDHRERARCLARRVPRAGRVAPQAGNTMEGPPGAVLERPRALQHPATRIAGLLDWQVWGQIRGGGGWPTGEAGWDCELLCRGWWGPLGGVPPLSRGRWRAGLSGRSRLERGRGQRGASLAAARAVSRSAAALRRGEPRCCRRRCPVRGRCCQRRFPGPAGRFPGGPGRRLLPWQQALLFRFSGTPVGAPLPLPSHV